MTSAGRQHPPGHASAEGLPLPGVTVAGSKLPGAVPLAGIALRFVDGRFAVDLVCEAGRAALSLGPFCETDVVAIWRSVSAASGLPLLIVGPDEQWQRPCPQLGRLLVNERADRRRLRVLSGRRPRFLVRRKPGRMPSRPTVYREREIVAGVGS